MLARQQLQSGIQQIYMREGLKKILFVLLRKDILISTNRLKQGNGKFR